MHRIIKTKKKETEGIMPQNHKIKVMRKNTTILYEKFSIHNELMMISIIATTLMQKTITS